MINKKLIEERKKYLESVNLYQLSKPKGTFTKDEMLKQISPDTGNLVSLLASIAPDGTFLELGTSAGYSSLWIIEGMNEKNFPLITHEYLDEKVVIASETFSYCDINKEIILMKGDCKQHIDNYKDISFCFLDCDNKLYKEIFNKIWPKFVPGGLLIADNIYSKDRSLTEFLDFIREEKDYKYYEINVGKGVSICQKTQK
ncbi:MAG: O-methyltransferase [archaeon]